jgi:hypothetical protein
MLQTTSKGFHPVFTTFNKTQITNWQNCQREVVRFEDKREHDMVSTLSAEGSLG